MTRTPAPTNLDLSSLLPLDAAPASLIDQTRQIRAQAHLQQILALPATPPAVAVPPRRATPRLRALRWAAIPVAAAGALAASIMVPGSPSLPPAHASFASWQAVPTTLGNRETAAADTACRAAISAAVDDPEQFYRTEPNLGPATVFSEARGEWATLAYVGSDTELTTCFVAFDSTGVPSVVSATTFDGLDSSGSYLGVDGSKLTTNIGTFGLDQMLAANQLQIARAEMVQLGEGWLSTLVGRVGSDVDAVVVHTITGGDVSATVVDGWFTAWWPGEFGGERVCMSMQGEDGETREFGCDVATAITVTFADGGTATAPFDAQELASVDQFGISTFDQG